MERIPVLLDTDIGSDIDDAVALAYLLRQPACELLGITTVSGEPERRASLSRGSAWRPGRWRCRDCRRGRLRPRNARPHTPRR